MKKIWGIYKNINTQEIQKLHFKKQLNIFMRTQFIEDHHFSETNNIRLLDCDYKIFS